MEARVRDKQLIEQQSAKPTLIIFTKVKYSADSSNGSLRKPKLLFS